MAVAVTGIGLVTTQGLGAEATWQGVLAGRDTLRPWSGAPAGPLSVVKVAECSEPRRPADWSPRVWARLGRVARLGLAAADEAWRQADLRRRLAGSESRAGVFVATSVCGMDLTERFFEQYRNDPSTADDELLRALPPYQLVALLARHYRISGPRQLGLTTCVGSTLALGAAFDYLESGRGDLALAGGADALCRVLLSGFSALKLVASDGCRPFDADRPGITVGEGAGMLVLETLASARARGATVLGLISGCAATCDAYHITGPDPAATQAARAIRLALEQAKVTADDIGYINAHGTGTRDNDLMESRALRQVFPGRIPLVSSTKRLTGHTFAAAGAIEAILCLQALRTGMIPGNAGTRQPDETLIATLPATRHVPRIQAALSCNFAFGGNNAALVFERADSERLTLADHHAGPQHIARCSLHVSGMGTHLDAANLPASADSLLHLAQPAAHAALIEAQLTGRVPLARIALLAVTMWGPIDATTEYLTSMLEDGGRYASPRYFARSVYSSVASQVAISSAIHGPCETLAFGDNVVPTALQRAEAILSAGRADAVLIVWADQTSLLADDVARRVAKHFGGKARRYAQGMGEGAVAVVVERATAADTDLVLRQHTPAGDAATLPYATDQAQVLARSIRQARAANSNVSIDPWA